MASPVTYNFEPDDIVWHITDDAGIKKAVVIRVTILEKSGPIETITYLLRYDDGSGVADATDYVYAEVDIDTALADYKTILTA